MAPVPVSASKSALLEAIGLREDDEYDEQIYRKIMVSCIESATSYKAHLSHNLAYQNLPLWIVYLHVYVVHKPKDFKVKESQDSTAPAAASCTSFLPRYAACRHFILDLQHPITYISIHTTTLLQSDLVPLSRMQLPSG